MCGGRRWRPGATAPVAPWCGEPALPECGPGSAGAGLEGLWSLLLAQARAAEGAPEPVDLQRVRSLCAAGVPEGMRAMRPTLWKLMLGYLPADVLQWEPALARARATHAAYLRDLVQELDHSDGAHSGVALAAAAPGLPCSPPSPSAASEAGGGRAARGRALDGVLRLVIKDVARTRPGLALLSQPVGGGQEAGRPPAVQEAVTVERVVRPRLHRDVLARILLLYARVNPGVAYVQGMNELLAPIYELIAHDPMTASGEVEADAFFCFSLLMDDMREVFEEELSCTPLGALGRSDECDAILRRRDPEVWGHLQGHGVTSLLYTVRWITTLLAQELDLGDVVRAWDALLGDLRGPRPLLHYFCAARVIQVRAALLGADGAGCVGVLQRGGGKAPPVGEALRLAARLRDADEGDAAEGAASAALRGLWRAAGASSARARRIAGQIALGLRAGVACGGGRPR